MGAPEGRGPLQFWRTRNVLAVTAVLIAYIGLERESSVLVAWSILQGAFLVLMFGVGLYQVNRTSVRRRVPIGAFEDEPVTVELLVANRGWLPLYLLEIGDRFPPSELSYKKILVTNPIEGQTFASLPYQGHCFKRRGRYEVGPVFVRLSDPAGLFDHTRSLTLLDEFLVYPATIELNRLRLPGESPRQAARLVSERFTGASPSFHGTREYRTGDELRTVHWPTTARRNRLIVKEFDREVARHLVLFLDLHQANRAGLGQKSTLEYSVKIAASVARRATDARGLVSLYATGRHELYLPPGAGSRHLLRILSALVDVRQDGETPMSEALMRQVPRLPRGATPVFIFSGLSYDAEALGEVLGICRARGVPPIAVVLDQGAFLQLREPTARLHHAEDLATHLYQQGATVYLVGIDQDLPRYFDQPWEPGRAAETQPESGAPSAPNGFAMPAR